MFPMVAVFDFAGWHNGIQWDSAGDSGKYGYVADLDADSASGDTGCDICGETEMEIRAGRCTGSTAVWLVWSAGSDAGVFVWTGSICLVDRNAEGVCFKSDYVCTAVGRTVWSRVEGAAKGTESAD